LHDALPIYRILPTARNDSDLFPVRWTHSMKLLLPALVLLAAATTASGADFSAADVPGIGVRQPGRIVIRNRGNTITAWRFFGNIREALLTLRSVGTLHATPYGPVLFDSSAHLASPMPAQVSSMIEE